MKVFKVFFFNPSNQNEIFEDLIKSKSEILAKQMVRHEGYEIKEIYEVEYEKTSFEKMQERFDSKFTTGGAYNPEVEISILRSFAIGLKDGLTQPEALEASKYNFAKTNKFLRSIIDKMVDDYGQKGITHISDVFEKNSNIFSENFLTLMNQSKRSGAEINIDKIISNPVSEKERGTKVEGYVELTESITKLKKEIISALSGPVIWFLGTFGAAIAILAILVPGLLAGFAKIRDISKDDYTIVGNTVIVFANFLTGYGLYILFFLIGLIITIIFFYNNNESFKEQMHLFLLRMPIVGDIMTVFLTKKMTSLIAIYTESGMNFSTIFKIIVPMVDLIPIKKELQYIQNKISSEDLDTIFKSYSDDEKFFTEMFYMQLAKESNRNSSITGRFGKAFATIIKNTDDIWNVSLKKYPEKIGMWVKTIAMLIVVYFIAGIMLIIVKTMVNSL